MRTEGLGETESMDAEAVVTRFAHALDADDFAAAEACLAVDCVYQRREGTEVRGAKNIVETYRHSSSRAKELFDHVAYSSRVHVVTDGKIRIEFSDHLKKGDRTHTYREAQVAIVAKGEISRIVHEGIPNERERLNDFLQRVGVTL